MFGIKKLTEALWAIDSSIKELTKAVEKRESDKVAQLEKRIDGLEGPLTNKTISPVLLDVVKLLNHISTNYRDWETDRKSTRLNSSHSGESRMPSSA